ncbi:MAG: hypothetical protein EA409_09910 [Saprospirales bacterium]|nr:MAG: hypothetical protein EA409_09910 [Saprospirales bacterium]
MKRGSCLSLSIIGLDHYINLTNTADLRVKTPLFLTLLNPHQAVSKITNHKWNLFFIVDIQQIDLALIQGL